MQCNIPVSNDTPPRIKPIVAGYENCEKGHSYGPAVRHQWIIHYVVSGVGYFRIRGKEYALTGGNIFIIPPYVKIYYYADKENPWSYIWVGFEIHGNLPCRLEDTFYLPQAKEIFDKIKLSSEMCTTRTAFLTARIWDLFALLQESEAASHNPAEITRDIIHTEYASGITISEIAQRLNVNRSYLSVAFKEKYGVSPKQYLLNHRMSIAAILLQKQKRVNLVAAAVGYSDMFVFSNAFKKCYGVSPSEYSKKFN